MSGFTRIVLDNFLSFGHIELNLCGKGGAKRYAMVYGENGSGKTNLITSVRFLRDSLGTIVKADAMDAIRSDLDRNGPPQFPDDPMKQDLETAVYHLTKFGLELGPVSLRVASRSLVLEGSDGPMKARYEFDTDVCRISYEMMFSKDGTLIREELTRFTKGIRTRRLFLVESTSDGPVASFGHSVFSAELSRTLRRRIPVSWGTSTLMAILVSESSRSNPGSLISSVSEEIGAALAFINGLSVDEGPDHRTDTWPNGMRMDRGFVDSGDRDRLVAYGNAASSYLVRLYSDIKGAEYETRPVDGKLEYRLMVEKTIAGAVRRIPFEDESAGTRKLLGMLPALLTCSTGGTALIDEFDSGIHDKIIHDMLEEIIPELRGQLILTTHNTLLLDTAEPEHVYVIRIDPDGFKEIRTFDSIAPTRKGHHNNRQRYLQGLFDGIPFIRMIDLESIAEDLSEDLGGKS